MHPQPTHAPTRPRVLAHPHTHPYVDRLGGPDGGVADLVHRDEPMPALRRFHDPRWVSRHRGDWDLVHLHFGHEQHPVGRLVDVVATHRRAGTPVVATVHDLRIPHLAAADDPTEELLDALAPLVDAWTTLTDTAADVVADRLGTRPQVIPHGPLVPAGRRHQARTARRLQLGGVRTGLVWFGRLRPSHAVEEVGDALRAAGPTRVRLLVRDDDLDEAHDRLGRLPRGALVVSRPRMSHADLERLVSGASHLVLPSRWGTHSGMVEVATDLGVPVVVSGTGAYADQRAVATRTEPDGHDVVGVVDEGLDVDALARALRPRPVGPPTVADARRDALGRAFLAADAA